MGKKFKSRKVEVTSRSSFGQPSQMEREINKWTKEGWHLVDSRAVGDDRYILTFEYDEPYADDTSAHSGTKSDSNIVVLLIAILFVTVSFGVLLVVTRSGGSSQNTAALANAQRESQFAASTAARATANTYETASATRREVASPLTSSRTSIPASSTPTSIPTATPTHTPSHTPSPTAILGSVSGNNINARECPSVNCAVVSVVTSNEVITILGIDGDWYRVQVGAGEIAYIRGDLLEIPESAIVAIAPTITLSAVPSLTRRPAATPRPRIAATSVPSGTRDSTDSERIRSALNAAPDAPNPLSVSIVNSRSSGGYRELFITYLTGARTETQLLEETLIILDVVEITIRAGRLDIDNVVLLGGDSRGSTVGLIGVSVDDIAAYQAERITLEQLIARMW
jgi:SH3-like domain-containing protein